MSQPKQGGANLAAARSHQTGDPEYFAGSARERYVRYTARERRAQLARQHRRSSGACQYA